jgi:hypothetical protein
MDISGSAYAETDPIWTDLDSVRIPGLDDRVAWLMSVEV